MIISSKNSSAINNEKDFRYDSHKRNETILETFKDNGKLLCKFCKGYIADCVSQST
jgi:hypothetical protein